MTTTNHYGADHFRVLLAITADPLLDAAFWSNASEVVLQVQVEMNGALAVLIEGLVDSVTLDPFAGTVELLGRDRTALLIEARTQETFANRTSSEIAEMLATRHGLLADVDATTTPVGRYWQLEHDRITLDQFSRATTEWDLLVGLAAREGMDVWVSGSTLHFRKSAPAAESFVLRAVDTLDGPANLADLQLERSLTLARDIEVVVKSWSSRLAKGFQQTARAARSGRQGGEVVRYHYVVPDLTPADALILAQRRLAELTRHERVIVAEMPGEINLDARGMLRLEGTGSAFDQTYWIDSIERRLDVHGGFRQTLRARNVSPGVEVQ